MKKLFRPHASVKVTFILLTPKYVSVIVNLVDDLLCIHWTMLSGSGRKEFKFTEYYRSVKAKTVYNAGLSDCARLYSNFGDLLLKVTPVINSRYTKSNASFGDQKLCGRNGAHLLTFYETNAIILVMIEQFKQ